MNRRQTRTVVTGIGVLAPNGIGTQSYWDSLLTGRTGIGRLTRFDPSGYPATLAGEIRDFDEAQLPQRLLAQTDRVTRLSLVGADMALADAGVDTKDLPAFDMGVVTASSSGGFEFGQRELANLWARGPEYVSAYQSFAWFYAVNSGQISIRNGLRGPSGVVVSDQAGGLDAIAHARRQIRRGAKLMISGGVDATLCPWGWVGLQAGGRLSTGDDPNTAYLPFDARARGHVPGEGGALLVLENADHAVARGARCYGEIAGHAATFDPRPGTGREPGLRKAIEAALEDADAQPADVDVVIADAAADATLDRIEAEAITKMFGAYAVPVTTPKTLTGRLYSGAGSLDLATALLSIRTNTIPRTHLVTQSRDHDIDLVTEAPRTNRRIGTALVLGRGEGGFNSAVVVREFQAQ